MGFVVFFLFGGMNIGDDTEACAFESPFDQSPVCGWNPLLCGW